jgi:hypothetical protein
MGEIYLAEDTTLGREVAVKLLDERFARDRQVRKRFKREALTAARLSGHPHVVTIFDVGEQEDGRPFIVMEHLTAGDVGEQARAHRIPHEQALRWLEQTAMALDEAHAAGIVHRDVKPANLLLDERQNVSVCDFGIARKADEATLGLTAAGTVLGTAGYLSPEQARGEPATASSDLYGLGIVAYELFTGGRPFEGGSATEEAAAHLSEPVPPASRRGVGLPSAVDPVFERALAKDPRDRYGSARELVSDLRAALDPRTRSLPLEKPPRRRGSVGRPSWVPALAVALVLAALAAGGVVAAVLASGDSGDASAGPRTITQVTTAQGDVTTVIRTTTPAAKKPKPPGGHGLSPNEAAELTDEATNLMRAGDYRRALPLARRAYESLRGSGDIYEAYAAYDTGASYIALGRCDKGLPLLDASEAIQGPKPPIDHARRLCAGGGDEGHDNSGPGSD